MQQLVFIHCSDDEGSLLTNYLINLTIDLFFNFIFLNFVVIYYLTGQSIRKLSDWDITFN
jgi:hypothetical protein